MLFVVSYEDNSFLVDGLLFLDNSILPYTIEELFDFIKKYSVFMQVLAFRKRLIVFIDKRSSLYNSKYKKFRERRLRKNTSV